MGIKLMFHKNLDISNLKLMWDYSPFDTKKENSQTSTNSIDCLIGNPLQLIKLGDWEQ